MTEEMLRYEAGNWQFREGAMVSGVMFWNVHGGLLEVSGRSQEWDPYLKRPVKEYLKESLDKGYQYVWPKPGDDPRIIFEYGSNILRRLRSYPLVLKTLFPKLKAFVTIDWRMTSSAMASDYVLPAAGWYEKNEHKWGTPLMPYLRLPAPKAVSFQEGQAGLGGVCVTRQGDPGARHQPRHHEFQGSPRGRAAVAEPVRRLHHERHLHGERRREGRRRLGPTVEQPHRSRLGTVEKKGYARFTGIGRSGVSIGNACDIKPDDTVSPFRLIVEGEEPRPTTRRISSRPPVLPGAPRTRREDAAGARRTRRRRAVMTH